MFPNKINYDFFLFFQILYVHDALYVQVIKPAYLVIYMFLCFKNNLETYLTSFKCLTW